MASQPEATIKRKLEPEEIGVSLILAVTQALFENRETVPERAFDRILKFTKQMLQRTERDREVRCVMRGNLRGHDSSSINFYFLVEFRLTSFAGVFLAQIPRTGKKWLSFSWWPSRSWKYNLLYLLMHQILIALHLHGWL